jgi:benzoate-CoA ligase
LNNFAEHLLTINAGRADKAAFIDDQSTLTYGHLSLKVKQFASGLRGMGLRREERVLVLMHDCNDWPVAFLGCIYAGVIPVAVNTLLTAQDYAYMLLNSRSQAVVVSAALLPTLNQALIETDGHHELHTIIVANTFGSKEAAAQDFRQDAIEQIAFEQLLNEASKLGTQVAATQANEPAFWLYSSGSTGRPKGTVHTHGNGLHTSELYGKAILGINDKDICFSAAKLFFAYGLGNSLTFPLSVGATAILMAERPTPQAVFKRLTALKPTVFFGAPTGFAGMLASPELPAANQVALRMTSSAGEALPKDLGERFSKHFGIEVIDGIGSTEMLHIYLSNRPGDVQYGTTGRPVPGYIVELRDEQGVPVSDGEPGDLYVKGPSSALMYWGNREKTQDTFQGAWTKTGDKYIRNQNGTYTYAGRGDDMLKVSGIYVSPFEVEATLQQHDAVLEAAVIGVNDENGLTRTKAFVVTKQGQAVSEEELKLFVKDRLAPYKYPRQIEFISELPKTATGKIQRFKLRDKERSHSHQA